MTESKLRTSIVKTFNRKHVITVLYNFQRTIGEGAGWKETDGHLSNYMKKIREVMHNRKNKSPYRLISEWNVKGRII